MVRAAGVEPACVQLPFLRLRRPRGYARICHALSSFWSFFRFCLFVLYSTGSYSSSRQRLKAMLKMVGQVGLEPTTGAL